MGTSVSPCPGCLGASPTPAPPPAPRLRPGPATTEKIPPSISETRSSIFRMGKMGGIDDLDIPKSLFDGGPLPVADIARHVIECHRNSRRLRQLVVENGWPEVENGRLEVDNRRFVEANRWLEVQMDGSRLKIDGLDSFR